MTSVETRYRNEAPEMRKVKNNVQMSNPSDLFAQGIDNLVRDPMFNPSQCDRENIEQARHAARKQQSRGNPFNSLLRQFANL